MASHPALLSWPLDPRDEYGLALWSAPAIEAATGGHASADFEVSGVAFDSREVGEGDLFVALKGERFDAHDFLDAARVSGAVAALASRGIADAGLAGLQVDDPLAALQTLATGWRARHSLPLIAVAGSNGKTTVTQMIAAILRAAHGEAALGTEGNLNNHIGVPSRCCACALITAPRWSSWA